MQTLTNLAAHQLTWTDPGHNIGRLVLDPDGLPVCASADLRKPLNERRFLVRTWPEGGEAWPRYEQLSVYQGDNANG